MKTEMGTQTPSPAQVRVLRDIYRMVTVLMQNEPDRFQRMLLGRDAERIARRMDDVGASYSEVR